MQNKGSLFCQAPSEVSFEVFNGSGYAVISPCYTSSYMSERLFQGQLFNHEPQDVTPKGFTHLPEIRRRPASANLNQTTNLGRFVREVSQPVQVMSPQLAADYLHRYIFSRHWVRVV